MTDLAWRRNGRRVLARLAGTAALGLGSLPGVRAACPAAMATTPRAGMAERSPSQRLLAANQGVPDGMQARRFRLAIEAAPHDAAPA